MRKFDRISASTEDHNRGRSRLATLVFTLTGEPDDTTTYTLDASFERDPKSGAIGVVTAVALDAPNLSGTELARFPWTRFIRLASMHALAGTNFDDPADPNAAAWGLMTDDVPDTDEGKAAGQASRREIRRVLGEVARPGRAGHPDGFYEGVAARWVQLSASGNKHPAATIAAEEYKSVSTVNGWLGVCRRRGLMPQSSRGRFGSAGVSK